MAIMWLAVLLLVFGGQCWALGDCRWHRFPGRQQQGWILLNLLLPLVGPILYVAFGRRSRMVPEHQKGKWVAYLKGFLALAFVNACLLAYLGYRQMQDFTAHSKKIEGHSQLRK